MPESRAHSSAGWAGLGPGAPSPSRSTDGTGLRYPAGRVTSPAMRTFIGSRLSALLASGAAVLIATAGVAAPAYAGGGAPAPGSAGLGDRLYPLLGNGGYDVQDYNLRVLYPRRIRSRR